MPYLLCPTLPDFELVLPLLTSLKPKSGSHLHGLSDARGMLEGS